MVEQDPAALTDHHPRAFMGGRRDWHTSFTTPIAVVSKRWRINPRWIKDGRDAGMLKRHIQHATLLRIAPLRGALNSHVESQEGWCMKMSARGYR